MTQVVTRQKQRVSTIGLALDLIRLFSVCLVERELHLPYTILHCDMKLMMCWLGYHSFLTVYKLFDFSFCFFFSV